MVMDWRVGMGEQKEWTHLLLRGGGNFVKGVVWWGRFRWGVGLPTEEKRKMIFTRCSTQFRDPSADWGRNRVEGQGVKEENHGRRQQVRVEPVKRGGDFGD